MDGRYAFSRLEYVCPLGHIRGVYGLVKLKGETLLTRSLVFGMRGAIGEVLPRGTEAEHRGGGPHQLFLTWPVGKI